jgi:long-chain acyl-CoA synthetase
MGERLWLDSYPPGMPAEIAETPFASVPDLLEEMIHKFGDKPAFHNLGRSLSFNELDRLSRDFAAFLQGLAGVVPGDRVAIMLPNLLQYPVVLFGILRAGLTVVNVNPLYTARELDLQLKDSGAKVIIVLENFASILQEVLPETALRHVISTQVGDMLPGAETLAGQFCHQAHQENGAALADCWRHTLPDGAGTRQQGRIYSPRNHP